MPLVIGCPKCGKKYQVGDNLAGKQVRCQQCSTAFVAAAQQPATPAADPLADLSLASLPATSAPNPLGPAVNPLGAPTSPLGPAPAGASQSAWKQQGVSNPSGGPTDKAMRLGSVAMVALGLFLFGINFVMDKTQGAIYLAPLFLAPLALILGIAGVINPNVVRAAGKYGGHLPWQYKAIGIGLVCLSLVITGLLVVMVIGGGYRPG
jgi:predicted Zn finger-like uncharacterized protein